MPLYRVDILRTLMVLADSKEQARIIARENEVDDVNSVDPDEITIREITRLEDVPKDWLASSPYGANGFLMCENVLGGS